MNLKKILLKIYLFVALSVCIFPISSVIAIDFDPPPISPYQGAYWGVNIGDIFRWNATGYHNDNILGSTEICFKINGTDLTTVYGDKYYCLKVRPMIYNKTLGIFQEDPLSMGLANVSLVNFTLSKMYATSPGSEPITLFIPKLDNQLMTDWCAEASYFQYKGHFDPAKSPGIYTTTNTIRYYNETSGDFIEMQFCNDGSLKSCYKQLSYFYGYSYNYTLEVERLYPECEEITNPSPTIPLGISFFLILTIAMVSLLVYTLNKKLK